MGGVVLSGTVRDPGVLGPGPSGSMSKKFVDGPGASVVHHFLQFGPSETIHGTDGLSAEPYNL